MSEEVKCKKCNGTGSYRYDENHGKICEECCKHNQGFFELKKYYGKDNGKMCCNAGCGFTKDKSVAPEDGRKNPFINVARGRDESGINEDEVVSSEERLREYYKLEFRKAWLDGNVTLDQMSDWWIDKLKSDREEYYDKGAMEASMVCNEKTIPLAIKSDRERIIERVEKLKRENIKTQDEPIEAETYRRAIDDFIKVIDEE